jgi:MoaA/NifB/PqqE/SkfB family radical SAM enzyme
VKVTRHKTWRQTLANIEEAVRREIPLRVGLIDGILPDQHAAEGEELLRARGVQNVGTDRLREFGRGTLPDPPEACGHCGHGRAAVLPNGVVTPCPMTRWMVAGNVRETSLGEIMTSVTTLAATLPAQGNTIESCNPNCVPDSYCNPLCTPGACKPRI